MSDAPIELTIVIPTFKERDNVAPLLDRLERILAGIEWQAVFVDDDSPDGTADSVRAIAQRDRRVRVIQRIGRRGLSSACVEGILSSSSPYVAVIDADLQHDETLLPEMLKRVKAENLDIAVASRYAEGGSTEGWDWRRQWISRFAVYVAQFLFKVGLKDPMSGFFLIRREAFDGAVRRLSQQGFKILFDIMASSPRPLKFAELPYQFGERRHGSSKLDSMAAWQFGLLILDKLIGGYVPVRFVLFVLVGGTGVFVHLAALYLSARGERVLHAGAGRRGIRRHDLEFHPEQSDHLSRPAPARLRIRARPRVLLPRVLDGRGGQRGRGQSYLPRASRLVAGGPGRGADRRGVELRRLPAADLESPGLIPPGRVRAASFHL